MKDWQRNWKDYYEILGVEPTANSDEIKSNYRKLMKEQHPDSNLEDGESARLINEAYGVLSDPEERKLYDLDYKRYKKKESSDYDIEKDYDEVEIKLAKQLSLKQIINEELEKVKVIINAKAEIIYSVFDENINNEIFYNQVKEYSLLVDNYICDLNVIIDKAKELGMYGEIDTITSVISELINIVDNMPTSIEATKKMLYKEENKEMVNNLISQCQTIILEFNNFFISLCDREVSKIQYEELYNVLLLKSNEALANLEKCLSVCEKLDIRVENSNEIIGKLHAFQNKLDYDSAVLIGKKLLLKECVRKSINDWSEGKEKILKIEKIVKKHPQNHHAILLRRYAKDIISQSLNNCSSITQQYDEILEGTNNDYYAEKLSKKAVDMFNQSKTLFENARKIFDQREIKHFTYNDLMVLTKGALEAYKEYSDLDFLKQASDIVALLEETTILYDEEFNELYENFKGVIRDIRHMDITYSIFEDDTDRTIKILNKYNFNINNIEKFHKKFFRTKRNYSYLDKLCTFAYVNTLIFLVLFGITDMFCILMMIMAQEFYLISLPCFGTLGGLWFLKNKFENMEGSDKLDTMESDFYHVKSYIL